MGSSRARARTRVPCIGRQILFFFFFINLFIYFWLCWVFVSARGLSLVAASGGHSSSRCVGLSLLRPLLLRSTGSRRAGSVVAHGPSCSVACGIFPDQGSNPCPLHWQADSQPLHGRQILNHWATREVLNFILRIMRNFWRVLRRERPWTDMQVVCTSTAYSQHSCWLLIKYLEYLCWEWHAVWRMRSGTVKSLELGLVID